MEEVAAAASNEGAHKASYQGEGAWDNVRNVELRKEFYAIDLSWTKYFNP